MQDTAQNVDTAENGRDTLAHDFPIFWIKKTKEKLLCDRERTHDTSQLQNVKLSAAAISASGGSPRRRPRLADSLHLAFQPSIDQVMRQCPSGQAAISILYAYGSKLQSIFC